MGIPLFFIQPNFICQESNMGLEIEFECTLHQIKQLDLEYRTSDSSKTNLVSDLQMEPTSPMIAFCQSAFFIGILIRQGALFSGIIFPFMTDYFGRIKILKMSLLIGGLLNIASGLTPDFKSLIFLLFLQGLCLTGFELTCMVYVAEIGAERFRKLSLVTLMSGWAVGQIIFPILFLYVNNWRVTFAVIIGLPMIVLTVWLNSEFYETPRYLVSK